MEKHKKESEFDNETFFEEYAKMAREYIKKTAGI